jgi:hypothetical protein
VETPVPCRRQDGPDYRFPAHLPRDKKAALRFFKKSVGQQGLPEKATIDKSGSNLAALEALQAETDKTLGIRQLKYLNNLVEQGARPSSHQTDHPAPVGFPIISLGPHHVGRHRAHAQD